MEKLKLLLVGGFLGSGKTTAIFQACRSLKKNNKKVGVVTNDQGTLQVDTEFMKDQAIPTAEVAAGCFCCHYNELEDRIGSLRKTAKPDFIFAEPVGSCVDLAATVVNPLLSLNPDRFDVVLSVFADCRLLVAFFQGNTSIFHDSVNYIFANQLKEADILVVNKIDLLPEPRLDWLKQRIGAEYGEKPVLFQNSLSEESVSHWLTACEEYRDPSLRPALDIDYEIYGAGEAELAWLDEEIGIVSPIGNAIGTAYELMRKLYDTLTGNGYPIGHLKFLLDDGEKQRKVSFTAFPDPGPNNPKNAQADRAVVIVNARIQVTPEILQLVVRQTIVEMETRTGSRITEYNSSAFQPGYPRPTHRINRHPSP